MHGWFFHNGLIEREGVTTMKLHNNNERIHCNNLFYWMFRTALANGRRDNNPHHIWGIMYNIHSVEGRAGVRNYTPRGDGRCYYLFTQNMKNY